MLDWSPLRAALAAAPSPPKFWWRDDDAVADTVQLQRMLRLSAEVDVPVHIAVIPDLLTPSLAPVLADTSARVLVHGWQHRNHAPEGEKKAEFRAHNTNALTQAEAGLQRLRSAFGAQCDAVFVPPWNRFEPTFAPGFADLGYRGLSLFGAATVDSPLILRNTHVDPIFWRGDRGLADSEHMITLAAMHLRETPDTPLGLLTHHLVQDDATWDFTRTFMKEMQNAGAQPWCWKDEI